MRFFAVDLRLVEITVQSEDGDETRTRREVAAHYDGSLTETEARARYDLCDQILCLPLNEEVRS